MNIYIDTSAFLAVLNANDRFHQPARDVWAELLSSSALLFSSNYVTLETTAVLQNRFGIEVVRLFENDVLPVVELLWVDETLHKQGMGALLTANRKDLSLVDCVSFELMRQVGLETAFTFDPFWRARV
jgi:predicted nucleic acid-binding protein